MIRVDDAWADLITWSRGQVVHRGARIVEETWLAADWERSGFTRRIQAAVAAENAAAARPTVSGRHRRP